MNRSTISTMPTTRRNGSTRQWRQLRAPWATAIATNQVRCTRCHQPIRAGEPWHLGHLVAKARGGTDQPTNLHPEHSQCNLRGATSPAIPQAQTFTW